MNGRITTNNISRNNYIELRSINIEERVKLFNNLHKCKKCFAKIKPGTSDEKNRSVQLQQKNFPIIGFQFGRNVGKVEKGITVTMY